jgi:arginase family enzyme
MVTACSTMAIIRRHRQPSSARPAKILKSGAFLLSLGGDHFVTWPLLKAHAAIHGPLALVQFDAHQDTWFDDGRAHRPRLLCRPRGA